MKVVEFAGLTASGKTTLCRGLSAKHNVIGKEWYTIDDIKAIAGSKARHPRGLVGVVNRLCMSWRPYRQRHLAHRYLQERSDLFLRAAMDYSALMQEVLDTTSGHPDGAREYARKVFVDNLLAFECASQCLKDGDVFWATDEGFCRAVPNVYGPYKEDDKDQRIARYVSLCPPVDVLVYLTVDPSLSLRRARERDGGRWVEGRPTWRGADDVILKCLREYLWVVELGNRLFRERGTRIIEIDTSGGDVRSTVDECADKLRSAGFQI